MDVVFISKTLFPLLPPPFDAPETKMTEPMGKTHRYKKMSDLLEIEIVETLTPSPQRIRIVNQKNRTDMRGLISIVWGICRVPLVIAQGIIQFVMSVVIGFALYILFYALIVAIIVWILI